MLSLINFVEHTNESEGRHQTCPSCSLPIAFYISRTQNSSLMSWAIKKKFIGLLEDWILNSGFKDKGG